MRGRCTRMSSYPVKQVNVGRTIVFEKMERGKQRVAMNKFWNTLVVIKVLL